MERVFSYFATEKTNETVVEKGKGTIRGHPKMTSLSDIRSSDLSTLPVIHSLNQTGPIHLALSPAHRY